MLQYFVPLTGYPYDGAHVGCPVCKSGKSSPISRFDRRLKLLPTVMCDDCGLFFTNPMPTELELSLYYRTQYRLDYQFALTRPGARHVGKKQREAQRRVNALMPFLPAGGVRMLDFGCGSGELVRQFALAGHSATGLEPGSTYARHAVDIAPERGTFRIDNDSWQSVAYPAGGFDLITMLHVLEHLPEPVAALKAAHRWLADDGKLMLEVPNMQGFELKGFERFHFAHVLGFSRDNLIHAAPINLAGTAQRNRTDYSQPVTILAYLRHHARRLTRRLRQ